MRLRQIESFSEQEQKRLQRKSEIFLQINIYNHGNIQPRIFVKEPKIRPCTETDEEHEM